MFEKIAYQFTKKDLRHGHQMLGRLSKNCKDYANGQNGFRIAQMDQAYFISLDSGQTWADAGKQKKEIRGFLEGLIGIQ